MVTQDSRGCLVFFIGIFVFSQHQEGCLARIAACGILWDEVIFMTACELTASITALANTLACGLSEKEVSMLGAVLTQLGDTLQTIAAQRSFCGSKTKP